VRCGEAVAEVIATGAKAAFGKGAELVRRASGVFSVTRNLALVGAVALMIVACAHYVVLPAAELIRLALTALLRPYRRPCQPPLRCRRRLRAQVLVRHRVLLIPLSAAHEAAASGAAIYLVLR
jgi:H+-transporting ATPase